MNLKTKTFIKRFIPLFVIFFILFFIFHQIMDLFKYTAVSISKNDITRIEVLTDENLKEMKETGKIKLKNGHTIITVDPKRFIEQVKNEYYIIELDAKKYYINIFIHYYIKAFRDNLICLTILLSIMLIMGKKRIKDFIKSAWPVPKQASLEK
ncbi:MAG: hypothetical protein PHV82_08085 [Victivallaceae bacterium]|nr:hypothetical protein [Victivallaceae bacterium]